MKIRKTAYVGLGVVGEYRASGQTRAEFCRNRGMPVTTLDYYLRRDGDNGRQKLVPVKVVEEVKPRQEPGSGFTLVTPGNMRIEIGVGFDEEALGRLLAVLERS
jgi:hypothetical protein